MIWHNEIMPINHNYGNYGGVPQYQSPIGYPGGAPQAGAPQQGQLMAGVLQLVVSILQAMTQTQQGFNNFAGGQGGQFPPQASFGAQPAFGGSPLPAFGGGFPSFGGFGGGFPTFGGGFPQVSPGFGGGGLIPFPTAGPSFFGGGSPFVGPFLGAPTSDPLGSTIFGPSRALAMANLQTQVMDFNQGGLIGTQIFLS